MPLSRRSLILLTILALAVGAALGLGLFTFVYAQGYSYMRDDPAVCANCHVMKNHLDAWSKGSHKDVASCNGCHTPRNAIGKYVVKGINGFNHSVKFTTGNYPDVMRANSMNKSVTETACRTCHADVIHDIDIKRDQSDEEVTCVRCHRFVGHDL
jgi:cytochrome c nitrite reductase small subunit